MRSIAAVLVLIMVFYAGRHEMYLEQQEEINRIAAERAIEAAKASEFLKAALGEDMHRTFTAIKAAEYGRVMRTVSEVDFDLYLHTV